MKRTDKDYLSKSREVGQYLNSLTGKWKLVGNKRNKLYGVQKTWVKVLPSQEIPSVTTEFSVTEEFFSNISVTPSVTFDEDLNTL